MVETSEESDVYQYVAVSDSWRGELRDSYGEAMQDVIDRLVDNVKQGLEIHQVRRSDGASSIYLALVA